MGYYINQIAEKLPPVTPVAEAAELARWQQELAEGSAQQKRSALRRLVLAHAEEALAACLQSADPEVVSLARTGLWECWLGEAGETARRELDAGTEAMNEGDLGAAAKAFSRLMDRHPDWAEAVNKLATVFYLQGEPAASIELCRQVVALKPDHFGAWNGLALCAIQVEDWSLALKAVQESLRLQPHSPANRQLLELVESRLPKV